MKRRWGPQMICVLVAFLLGSAMVPLNPAGAFTPLFNTRIDYYLASNGEGPVFVAIGDLNGDGYPDLVVTNSYDTPGTVSVLLGNGDGTFQTPVNYAAGILPASVAIGDFNGDGRPDLAVAEYGSSSGSTDGGISVLLGNGDGTFQAPVYYAAGTNPTFVAAGDFNGDGYLDLAVANYYEGVGGNSVSVLLGNGDGTFQTPVNYAVGIHPASVAIGDFNGDGHLDLVVADNGSSSTSTDGGISVLLGKGDGTFKTAVNYAEPGSDAPNSVAVGDFNKDGKPDLAVATRWNLYGNVIVYLGNGDGTFQPPVNYGSFGKSISVVTGDLDGDGNLDLVVTDAEWCTNPTMCNDEAGEIQVLFGNGDGTFSRELFYGASVTPYGLAIGDLNGDGKLDLAVTNFDPVSVSVLLGNGDGTFKTPEDLWHYLNEPATAPAVSNPSGVAIGDLNGDGKPDLAVANNYSVTWGFFGDAVTVFLGNGNGTFGDGVPYSTGTTNDWHTNWDVAIGDFNGDGYPDLAAANGGNWNMMLGNTVSVLLGNGDGTFKTGVEYGVGTEPSSVAIGDFNGDGYLDLAVSNLNNENGGTVSVLLGNGDGTFKPKVDYAAGIGPNKVAIGDFNGDGHLDLVVANLGCTWCPTPSDTVSVFLGNGDGTFQAAVNYHGLAYYPTFVAVGDLNGDGHLDLAVTTLEGEVFVLLGNGDGTFGTAVNYMKHGGWNGSVAIGDLNGDGKPDLAVTDYSDNTVAVLLGNGDGTFNTPVYHYGVGVSPGPKQGSYHAVGVGPGIVAMGDLNGDGRPDLAVTCTGGALNGDVSVLLNKSCTTPATPTLSSPSNGATNVSTTPTLTWGTVSSATTYDVQVCSDSGCSTVVTSASGLTTTQWTVSPALNKNTTYFWRARANNSCTSGPWSSAWSFTVVQCLSNSDCDDGNPCTDDTCNPATGCVHTNNTAPCNDGNACTVGDACSGGVCVGGPSPNCDDGNVCTDDSCNPTIGCIHTPNTAPCDDGNPCTTNDTCSGGVCVGGSALNCDDGNPCTDDTCNPATGCVHTNNTAVCNDGNACTTNDTCSGGTCAGSCNATGPADPCCSNSACVGIPVCQTCTLPGTPSLSSPSNGATNVATAAPLSWGAVTDATSYDVQVCSDSGCSTIVTSASGLTTTKWTVSPALNKNTAYFWSARANNACGSSAWATPWGFTTGNCFIATAAYGTAMQGKIDVLRSFRDSYLTKTTIGKAFVEEYYSHSPPVADYIGHRSWLRAVVRVLLAPVIGFVSLLI